MRQEVDPVDGFEYREGQRFLDVSRGRSEGGFWLPYDPTMLKIEQRVRALEDGANYMLKVTSPLTPPVLGGGGTPKEFLQYVAKELHGHLDALDRLIEEL